MKNNGTSEDPEEIEGYLDDDLYTILDDDVRVALDELVGLKVAGLEIWEDSLGDEEDQDPTPPEERIIFDCDLFMEEGLALELYVTAAYPDPDQDPIAGLDTIYEVVGKLVDQELVLLDYDQADDEGGLALAFGSGESVQLVLVANLWMVSGWEEGEGFEDFEDEEAL